MVIWIGENVKVMRRARVSLELAFDLYTGLMLDYPQVSVHAADVKKVLRAYSIEVSASTPTDLEQVKHMSSKLGRIALIHLQDDIVTRLRRAGGANYDRSKFD